MKNINKININEHYDYLIVGSVYFIVTYWKKCYNS